jgi:hypothetical protein
MSVETSNRPLYDPLQVLALGTGFAEAKVVLAALELGLFAHLGDGSATEQELRADLGIDARPAPAFLGVLVSLGLLSIEDGRYRNTSAARHYLIATSPTYVGGFLSRADSVLYPAWGNFSEALRTGRPQAHRRPGNPFDEVTEIPAQLLGFLEMMDAMNGMVGRPLAKAFDWSSVRTFTDLGGARGNLSAALVRAHPHLRGTVFDLPAMKLAFERHVEQLNVAEQVSFVGGDFFSDPLPSSEVMIFGHVLHDWSDERCQQLVSKAYEALPAGGTLLLYDPMLTENPSRLHLTISLHMLLTTEGGREYPTTDALRWFRTAGFADIESVQLGRLDTLVSGRKK